MELFHVHTYRCKHAEEIPDEAYVLKAIELEADSITFTDHAPFPHNQFRGRMLYDELPEYVASVKSLHEKYRDQIDVKCGLEIEYLPSFKEFYRELYDSGEFDVLMLGQHFYEIRPGEYSFMVPEKNAWEYRGCLEAILEGISTGLFQVVAHPDRSFRRIRSWTTDCELKCNQLIALAREKDVILEQNFSSQHHSKHYWKEFWDLVPPENKVLQGIDAHSISDMERFIRRKNGGQV